MVEYTADEKYTLCMFWYILTKYGLDNYCKFGNNLFEGCISFYKTKDIWVSFLTKEGQAFNYHLYKSLFDLCIDIFNSFNINNRSECIDDFAMMINLGKTEKIKRKER